MLKNKFLLITCAIVFFSIQPVFAEMLLFTDDSCVHCEDIKEYLDSRDFYEKFDIEILSITNNVENFKLYADTSTRLSYEGGQVPLLVNENEYFEGVTAIKEYFESSAPEPSKNYDGGITMLNSEDADLLNEIIVDEVKSIKPTPPTENQTPAKENNTLLIIGIVAGAFFILGLLLKIILDRRKSN